MISNKKIVMLCVIEYFLLLGYHIIYSILYCSKDQTYRITVWSLCVITILILFNYLFRKQLNLVVFVTMLGVIGSVSYVGYTLNTLAFGVIIFSCTSLTLALFLNKNYMLLWGIISTITLILYTVLYADMILMMVPTVFLYYGYIFAYVIVILFTYLLVSLVSAYYDSINNEKLMTQKESNLKNIFWANISNEIKTPMNVINGMSRLLKTESINARAKEYTDQIENASSMLLTIVNDTLELSHIETGEFEIKNVYYDLYRVAHLSVMEVSSNIHRGGVNIAYCINPKVPTVLKGDGDILQKIIVRLMSNALFYTDNGEVRLDIDANEITKKSVELSISIKDGGNGMTNEEIENLFIGFESSNINRTTEQESIGLSFKLCKSMIDAIGGKIEVSSIIGKGTTYNIILTQKTGDEYRYESYNAQKEDILDQSEWSGYDSKVLVIDDTPANLLLITGMIKLHGIETDGARNGKEALQMMENKKYDLVFIDYMMPDMDGEDTLNNIRSREDNENFKDIPLIALTSQYLQYDRYKFLEMGFDEFISKPIDDKELDSILKKFLKK